MPKRFLLLISLVTILFIAGCAEVETLSRVMGFDVKEVSESVLIAQLVKKFQEERPISSSIEDVYPHDTEISDYNESPASSALLNELKTNGQVKLGPGVYDFYLQSFCLNLSRHSPAPDTAYLFAPLKGSRAIVVRHLLENSLKHPEISQRTIQILLWAIEAGAKYGNFSPELQAVLDKLLSEKDLKILGKSFWDVIPPKLRRRIFREFRDKIPPELIDILEAYENFINKLRDSLTTYEELESIAMRFYPPAHRTILIDVSPGVWCFTDLGFYIRIFPYSRYSKVRIQIYVPDNLNIVIFNPAIYVVIPVIEEYQRLGIRAVIISGYL